MVRGIVFLVFCVFLCGELASEDVETAICAWGKSHFNLKRSSFGLKLRKPVLPLKKRKRKFRVLRKLHMRRNKLRQLGQMRKVRKVKHLTPFFFFKSHKLIYPRVFGRSSSSSKASASGKPCAMARSEYG